MKKQPKDYSALTIEDKRKALLSDWIARGENYVHQRGEGRLGWESHMDAGSPFSAFVLDLKDPQAVMRKACGFAQGLLDVMDLPHKVRIRLSRYDSSTDGSTVGVATAFFDDKDLSVGDAADIFAGSAVHEGCHVKWTDFQARSRHESDPMSLALQNILEDERIERRLGETYPGLANYLKKMKHYLFDKACRESTLMKMAPETAKQPVNAAARIVNAVLKLVRYPDEFSDEDLQDFGNELLQVRDVLTPFPASTDEACGTAAEIKEIIMRWLTTQPQQPPQQGGAESHDGQGSPQGGGEDKGGKKSKKSSTKGSKGDAQENPQGDSGDSSTGDGEEIQGESTGGSSDGKAKEGTAPHGGPGGGMTEKEAKRALEELAKELLKDIAKDANAKVEHDDQSAFVRERDGYIDEVMRGTMDVGQNDLSPFRIVYPEKLCPDGRDRARTAYRNEVSKVKPLVPSVRKILAQNECEYKRTARGRMNGTLDASKLAEAYQGAKPVYTQKEMVRTEKCAVCILVDESGSMNHGNRLQTARQSAVLLCEGLKNLRNVDLFIYGFRDYQLDVFCEHGHRGDETLGYMEARGGTPTGPAMAEAALRVRKQTRSKCLMLVVTDGEPNSDQDVLVARNKLEKDGFDVVGIGVDVEERVIKRLFKEGVVLSDIRQLPKELSVRVKAAVLSNRRHFSRA